MNIGRSGGQALHRDNSGKIAHTGLIHGRGFGMSGSAGGIAATSNTGAVLLIATAKELQKM